MKISGNAVISVKGTMDLAVKEGHLVDGEIVQDGLTDVGAQVYEWGHVDLRCNGPARAPPVWKAATRPCGVPARAASGRFFAISPFRFERGCRMSGWASDRLRRVSRYLFATPLGVIGIQHVI